MDKIKDLLQAFWTYRDQAIDQLEAGDLTKLAFLEANAAFFADRGLKPLHQVDSVEAAMFNYQYYNVQAKLHMQEASEEAFRNPALAKKMRHKAQDLYQEKDVWTQKILDIHGYDQVEAYLLVTRSDVLNEALFEIVLLDVERVILHSMDKRIQYKLRQAGAWVEGARPSRISTYVDSRY